MTNLDNLEIYKKHQGLLVLITSIYAYKRSRLSQLEKFDHIVLCDLAEWDFHEMQIDNCSVENKIDEITRVLELTTSMVDIAKVRLASVEEITLMYCAKLRQRYGIVGMQPSETLPYVDKTAMLDFVRRSNRHPAIQITDSIIINETTMAMADSIDRLHSSIEDKFDYPIFAKPRSGIGATGSAIVENREQLQMWVEKTKQRGMAGDYLIQKCYKQMEWISLVITGEKPGDFYLIGIPHTHAYIV